MVSINTRKHFNTGDSLLVYIEGHNPKKFSRTTFFDGDGKTNVEDKVNLTVLDSIIYNNLKTVIAKSTPLTSGAISIYQPDGERPIATWKEGRGDNNQGGNLSFGENFYGRLSEVITHDGQNHLLISNYPFLEKLETDRLKKIVIEKDIYSMGDRFLNTRLFVSKTFFEKISSLIDDLTSFTSKFKDVNVIDNNFVNGSVETILGKVVKVLPENKPEELTIVNGTIMHCDGVISRKRSDNNYELTLNQNKEFKFLLFVFIRVPDSI